MDGTSVFSTQFWVGKGMGRFFFSLDLMFGVQDGAQFHCENSDSLNNYPGISEMENFLPQNDGKVSS